MPDTPPLKDGLPADLRKAVTASAKKYKTRIGSLAEVHQDVEALTTGNLAIDQITGIGGLPRARITELFGPPASGKTTTGLQTAIEVLAAGGVVAYADHEHAVDLSYAESLGLDPNNPRFLFMQPDSLEDSFNTAASLIETGQVDLYLWDSLASMVPEKALTAESGTAAVALRARLVAQALEKFNPLLSRTRTSAVFINHLRYKLDMSQQGQRSAQRFGPAKTTPGGDSLKFYASMRIEYTPAAGVKEAGTDEMTQAEEKMITGQDVRIAVVKNKLAAPFGRCVARVRYGKGFSNEYAALTVLVAHKVIKKKTGGIFEIPAPLHTAGMQAAGLDYIRGERAVLDSLEQDPVAAELWDRAARRVLEKAQERAVLEVPLDEPEPAESADTEE